MGRWLRFKEFGNVLAMKPGGEPENMRSLLWQIEAYWNALPRTGAVPRRTDVDPRGIEALLHHAVILERVAPGVARFRIAGQHLADLSGCEVRGMPITAIFCGPARDRLGAALSRVFDTPAVLHAGIAGETRIPGRRLRGRMVLLPLCLDNGEISRALGAIVTNASSGLPPQKLTLTDLALRPVAADRNGTPRQATGAFAEPVRPLAGRPPRLRLVHSSD